jgi:membrane protein YqaA with SNARE-associated domain
MSTLTDIFTESAIARLLPMQHEVTLPAMWSFGEPPLAAFIAAGAGGLLAGALLYGVGVWLRRMPKHVSTPEQLARIEKMRRGAHGLLSYLLILAPTPVGGMLTIAAGFFAVRPWLAALMLIAAEAAWRLSPLVK